jgi:uncharacterized radical SAM superfamily Fe-S cluster-containing enzyme
MDSIEQPVFTDLPPTESLCPECLCKVPAFRIQEGADVYLVKCCPDHGEYRSIIWRGPPDYASRCRPKADNHPGVTHTASERGCPLDCGLCPEHAQQTCCVLLEVTYRCDLGCPVCFASAGGSLGLEQAPDPGLDEIEGWYRLLKDSVGRCNIQLSGGEPTMRDDLPEVIALGRERGFSFFQLNTNGLRLASERGYAEYLKQAGLSTVFLQFDGVEDDVYCALRGRPLLHQKQTTIANCARAGLGVVLVPTLVPGVNTGQIGRIIDYALQWLPHVRGVHFQPISYFGRYPQAPLDEHRYTLPELMRDIEAQTNGRILADSFYPSGCGHSLCSFSGDYVLMPGGAIHALTDPGKQRSCCGHKDSLDAAQRQRSFIARRWAPSTDSTEASTEHSTECCRTPQDHGPATSLDQFLDRVRNRGFTITAMAFQDVWTLDLERLRNCHLHVVAPGGRIVPFCAHNLTDARGNRLHDRAVNGAIEQARGRVDTCASLASPRDRKPAQNVAGPT